MQLKIYVPVKKYFDNNSGLDIDFENNERHDAGYFVLDPGYVYTVSGNNGTGKTTLMNILSLLTGFDGAVSLTDQLLTFNKRSVQLQNNDIKQSEMIRKRYFSYIFQDAHLINYYTLEENLLIVNNKFYFEKDLLTLQHRISGLSTDHKFEAISQKIDKFIKEKKNTPYYLSGGEKQLLSFIRAMLKPSRIIFADEPWASMDKTLKFFIENQFYAYLHNQDIFADIRNRTGKITDSNMVIIISHPVQKYNISPMGTIDNSWKLNLSVKSLNTPDTDPINLVFERNYVNNK